MNDPGTERAPSRGALRGWIRPTTSRSRLLSLVIVVAALGAPAAVLRGLCVGHSCDEEASAASEVPFCSLPDDLRRLFAAGFEGELHRSPDILGVTGPTGVSGRTVFGPDDPASAWPSREGRSTRVPIVFTGAGVDPEASVPDGTGLDDVAPTIAAVLGFQRSNPQVRSGVAVEGVASGQPPRLVIEVALKNVGSSDVDAEPDAWTNLRSLLDDGAGTLEGDVGSIPVEPTASLTTMGTGGLPNQHGIVGTALRDNEGNVVRAWGPRSPVHIIATLPDDLDERLDEEPRIGLVRTEVSDRGLIGGNWYVEVDRDEIVTDRRDPAGEVERMIRSGFGDDEVPDVIGVALEGDAAAVDEQLGSIASQADAAGATLVVAGSGSIPEPKAGGITAQALVRQLEDAVEGADPVIDAAAPGGVYLEQETLVKSGITEDDVLNAFVDLEGADGRPLFADAFPAIAVSFARYC